MACPSFSPTSVLPASHGIVPLGDVWAGECAAGAAPGAATLRDLCNQGYARGRCPHFRDGAAPDAVRFQIARGGEGLLRIACAVEKDYLPYWHGTLEYSAGTGAVSGAPNATLERQAAAYARSYLRRKDLR